MKSIKSVVIVLFTIGCTQTTSPPNNSELSTETQIPEDAVVRDYESTPGLQKAVIKSQDITLAEGDFLNGRHHGTWSTYAANGRLEKLTTYVNGKKQGVELIFDNMGYVLNKAYYHNDLLSGEFLVYKRRSIIERKSYLGGKLHGLQQRYYTDGHLMEEKTYVDNVLHGIAYWYDQNGGLIAEYKYEMGELIEE